MIFPFVNIHTHARTGHGVELVSVMAGREARLAARAAVNAGCDAAADLAGTASVEPEPPAPPYSVGVHPWEVGGGADISATFATLSTALAEVESAALLAAQHSARTARVAANDVGCTVASEIANANAHTDAGCAAIGEIGLDAAIREADANMAAQREVFAAQLAIAERHARPVVLHCVRAFEAVMDALAEYRLSAVVFHGFIGSTEQAARAVAAGYHLSFGPRSLASPRTVEAMRAVPLDRLFLETDAERATIEEVYSRAAEILGVAPKELVKQLYNNYMKIFKI